MADHDIARPHHQWEAIRPDLELIHDLMGGTSTMRKAGLKWLPREQAESWEAWQHRLNRSVLFNGLARCIKAMCGHIICGDIQLIDADPVIASSVRNIDGHGTSLNHFAMKLVYLMLRDGQAHIWVDAPKDGGRPYAMLFEADQMIGNRTDNQGRLTQVRFATTFNQPHGAYGVQPAEQVNLYRHDDPSSSSIDYELWQHPQSSGPWQQVENGEMNISRIPIVTAEVGMAQSGYVRPPLIDLAWLNLAHWQSASDQRHILHIARVPILFAKGIADGGAPLDIGPNRVIITDDPQADMKFIEHSGAAIEAGRQDLIDLEDKMMMMGLDMMAARQAHPTATSQIIEQAHHKAILSMVTEAAKDALTEMFALIALWQDRSVEAGGHVVMPQPDPASLNQRQDAQILMKARETGDISKDEFLQEIERRGILNNT